MNNSIFWSTIAISFVLLVHNGLEPVYIFALAAIPLLALLFYRNKSAYPLIAYLLAIGAIGRYTRYLRQTYASDVLLATRDFIGIFLSGRNPYNETVYVVKGLTPFAYLPFELFWYLPAYIFQIDLRFFEMIVAIFIPVLIFLYIAINKAWKTIPLLAVVSLTPFLLDLSADGSNDNSAIFILLVSILLLILARIEQSKKLAIISAVVLGLALAFKHFAFFYLLFLSLFFWQKKRFLPIKEKKYIIYTITTASLLIVPFFLTAPAGFLQSQLFLEKRPDFPIWGWNIWNGLKIQFGIAAQDAIIQIVRILLTLSSIILSFRVIKLDKFNKVLISTTLTIFVYLIFSKWTSYSYFSFLLPLLILGAIGKIDK